MSMWEPETAPMPREQERPILFIKTGVICSEPLGFYQELADTYAADLHSADGVRLELSDDGISFSGGMNRRVNGEMEDRTITSLDAGFSVVYDGFVNTRERRQQLKDIARSCGANAVVTAMRAPMPLIQGRIRERHYANTLTIPSDLIDLDDTLKLAHSMLRTAEVPTHEEENVRLDGTRTTGRLLSKMRRYLERHVF